MPNQKHWSCRLKQCYLGPTSSDKINMSYHYRLATLDAESGKRHKIGRKIEDKHQSLTARAREVTNQH